MAKNRPGSRPGEEHGLRDKTETDSDLRKGEMVTHSGHNGWEVAGFLRVAPRDGADYLR